MADPEKQKLEMTIPPGGFISAGQQTQAVQLLVGSMMGSTPRTRRKKKRTTKKRRTGIGARKSRRTTGATRKKTTRRAPRKRTPLKKGSPAAKRRMAELRAMKARKARRR